MTDLAAPTQVFVDLVRRLQANVAGGLPDMADAPMKVPAASYDDAERFVREIERIFHVVPLLVALSCDVREPGEYMAYDIAGRPIVVIRGDDGKARTFLNVCRHRGRGSPTSTAARPAG